jgi:transcriptional regulator with XRE-family HTH domain
VLKTHYEMLADLGAAIRARRIAQNWSQEEAARRAGMGVRTWRRLEAAGKATTENLLSAAVVLRCEDRFSELFPQQEPRSMDELLEQQRLAGRPERRRRVSKRVAR